MQQQSNNPNQQTQTNPYPYRYQPQPQPQYPPYCPYCQEKLEIKPTFSLAWGLMWRMWILAIPVYIVLLVLQLALK